MSLNPLGLDDEDQPTQVIRSRINGEFAGWAGRTEFMLLNGQVWRQDSFNYRYRYAVMPRVAIFKTDSGHRMRVEGVPGTIPVSRLR